MPRIAKKTSSAIGFSLLFAFAAQLLFVLHLSSIAAVLLYALAAYFFLCAAEGTDGDSVGKFEQACENTFNLRFAGCKLEWLLAGALLLLAAFFRLYHINSQPASLWLDESLTGLNALEIINGKSAPFWGMTPLDRWRPDWVKTSNLYLYYVVLVFKVFGADYFGLKMVSVLPAIGSVAASYFLFKEISNRAVAFVSAFLLAVSQWHVTISRWGWDAVLMSLLQLISYGLLLRGLKAGKKWQLILSGAVVGLCLYTYVASWIALAIALLFLVVEPVLNRRTLRAGLEHGFLFLSPCIVVFAPLIAHYLEHPADLTVRIAEVSLAVTIQTVQSFLPLLENFGKYALMFNYTGDGNPRHGLPHAPCLDFVTAMFFVLGVAYCLRFCKRSHAILPLLWFAMGLQAGLLADPNDSPNAYRIFIISPVVCYFSAIAMSVGCNALSRLQVHLKLSPRPIALVALPAIAFVLSFNYWVYFVKRPEVREVWEEEARDAGLGARIASLRNESRQILVDPALLWKIVVSNTGFLNYRFGQPTAADSLAASLFTVKEHSRGQSSNHEIVYIYSPVFARMVRSLFPDAGSAIARSPFGDALYGLIVISSDDLRSRLATVSAENLSRAIQTTASFYQTQALADTEIGPRRILMYQEYRKLAGLDPQAWQELRR